MIVHRVKVGLVIVWATASIGAAWLQATGRFG